MDARRGDARIEDNPGFARLTPRELDCLRALRANGEAKLAARSLSIGLATFNEHLAKARRKLGVSRSWEAARLLGERDAGPGVEVTPSPVADAPTWVEDSAPGTPERSREPWFANMGPWGGPALVAITAAFLALAALMIWATAELALRFQDLK